jgi:hypothetical protein
MGQGPFREYTKMISFTFHLPIYVASDTFRGKVNRVFASSIKIIKLQQKTLKRQQEGPEVMIRLWRGYIDNVFFLMGWLGGLLPMCKEKETEIAGVQQKGQ